MTAFAARFPILFHVTSAAALPSIRQNGLLSASRLCARFGAPAALLDENRKAATAVGPHILRRQGMSDRAILPRLGPGLTPAAWRRFINGLVFFFPTEAAARRLAQADPLGGAAILRFQTTDLMAAVALRACRFNNGYVDRAPLAAARRRQPDDYRPVQGWDGSRVVEVATADPVPVSTPFTVLILP